MLRSGGGDSPNVLLAKSIAPFNTGRHRRLVTYLVAAHHGKVRISVRAEPDEAPAIVGVLDGDQTPEVTLSNGETFPAQSLSVADFRPENGGSWTVRARALRDRGDLGPFRLGYLEALVRIADWRSSARHDGPVELPPAVPDSSGT